VTSAVDHPFLGACRGEPVARTPVWFMRQAGRSLPEYRALRGEGSILEAIKRPDLAAELTLQPVRRHGVDAAVLYSDIVVPIHAIGFGVDVAPGTGPVVAEPFRGSRDLDRLRPLEPDVDTPYVVETVRILAKELTVPLLAFAGAPFTVASYLVEGRPSRTYAATKALMYGDEPLWHRLLERLTDLAVASLRSQISNGAQAFQVFDSWVGTLSPDDYSRYVLPHSRRLFAELADLGAPGIHFGITTGELLDAMASAGPAVVGVDWRTPIDRARERIDAARPGVGVQGNLDPCVCLCPWEVVEAKVREVLTANDTRPGHIFNLGHGVLPETDPGVLGRIVALVHEVTSMADRRA
jgi:uroporphyrinogen decarboxylase